MRKPTEKKKTPLEQAKSELDEARMKTNAACADLLSMADRVVERLRKRARPLRLVKARHG